MVFHIRDAETDRVVRELARRTGASLTEAIKLAAAEKLAGLEQMAVTQDEKIPFLEHIRDIQDRIAAYPDTGQRADKSFYDALYED